VDILFIAIPIALIIAGIFLAAFLWATHSGQWDDLDTPAWRMLMDDEEKQKPD